MHKRLPLYLGSVVGIVGLAFLASWQPFTAIGAALAIPVLWGAFRSPSILLYAALGSVALGQAGRIPPLHGGAPLLADGFLGGLFLIWLVWAVWKRISLPRTPAHLAWYGFLVVGIISLIFTPYHLNRGEFITAALYWVRLVLYSSLIWIVPSLYRQAKGLQLPYKVTLWSGVGVVGLGVLQLVLFPNIGILSRYGWDPHVGRFVSTFLDPNYLGGYFAMLISFVFALNREKPRFWLWVFGAATIIASVLTFSRSGYLALAVTLVIIGLSYSWKLLLVAVVCILPLALSIPRIAQRIEGGFKVDATSQDRIKSWKRALAVIEVNPILGVGYNNYERAQEALNLTRPNDTSLAASGSDSSLLNVFATTGFVGFVLFFMTGFFLMRDAFRRIRTAKQAELRIAGWVILIATPALLVNAMFVNALFYPLILIVYAFFIGALYVGEPESSVAP